MGRDRVLLDCVRCEFTSGLGAAMAPLTRLLAYSCNACGLQWGKQFPKGASSQEEAKRQLALLAEARRTKRWNPPTVTASPANVTNSDDTAASATLPVRQAHGRPLTGSKSSGNLLRSATLPSPADSAIAYDPASSFSSLHLNSPLQPTTPSMSSAGSYRYDNYMPKASSYGSGFAPPAQPPAPYASDLSYTQHRSSTGYEQATSGARTMMPSSGQHLPEAPYGYTSPSSSYSRQLGRTPSSGGASGVGTVGSHDPRSLARSVCS